MSCGEISEPKAGSLAAEEERMVASETIEEREAHLQQMSLSQQCRLALSISVQLYITINIPPILIHFINYR